MSWLLLVRPRAEQDLVEARDWYEERVPGLGDDFLHEVSKVMELLVADPERPPFYYRGFRRVLLRRFPYKVFYRVEDGRVVVFRVLHGRRDHPRWLHR
jgi:plasmid stabilization system protein ParE